MLREKISDLLPTTLRRTFLNISGIFVISALFIFGCSDSQLFDADHLVDETIIAEKTITASLTTDELLREVKKATARFNSTTQAARAGYEVMGHCVYNPEMGGMGYHWVNGALVDPVFNPLQPEALLYEPDKNGNLKLVGVEYIVINVGQDQPYFGDHPFDVGGTPTPVDHWSLHVWLYKNNPNGVFSPFNPNVTCPLDD